MRVCRRVVPLIFVLVMVFALSGCMMANVEELYSLPRMSEEYIRLQELIARRIDDGGEYAAPLSGSHRQSVQLQDLNGDGVSEAVAFLADEDHTPTVCVYRLDGEGNYYLFVDILGAGTAVSSVDYADLNGDGATEILIAWQIGGDLQLLSAYDLSGDIPVEILSADCSAFLVNDLNDDGVEEVLDLHIDYAGTSALVMYVVGDGNTVTASRANLSAGITEVLRARMGRLSDDIPALFVESIYGGDRLITDVFAVDGGLKNITLAASGVSNTTREMPAYAADINDDRVMEIPESSGGLLNWYALDAAGRKTLALTTWHDYENGWYLVLDDEMLAGLKVEAGEEIAGEASARFSKRDGGDLFVIYTLTGENRLDRAAAEDRFILAEEETTVYAAEILSETVTGEEILERFNLIYSEWQTGDL